MRAKRFLAGLGALGAIVVFDVAALSPTTFAQATVSEGATCAVMGATAVSSSSGRALVCTDLLDNGGGTDGLRWHVQTAVNMPGAGAVDPTTTVAPPTTATPNVTAPPSLADASTSAASAAADAGMPTTGVNTGRWVGEAGSLAALGTALLIAARRRRKGFRAAG